MGSFIEALEKAELHVHLEGSVEPETLCELDPSLRCEDVVKRYSYADFAGFIEAFKWVVGYLRTPDDFALATRRLLDRLAAQNVRYAEINLSAGVMLWRKQDFAAIYDAVDREAQKSPVDVWWILDAVRQFGPEHAMDVARLAVERAGDRVVGFGVGGDEARGPIHWFGEAFEFARNNGVNLVPHAGETAGSPSIWGALELGATRIGHGIRAAEDPELMAVLRDRDIPLEVSIHSNIATGAVGRLEDHPVRRLFDAGVPIVLNTDDPAMFRTTLNGEFQTAQDMFGFTPDELSQIARNGFRYGFRSASYCT